jgi:hypothetical protein
VFEVGQECLVLCIRFHSSWPPTLTSHALISVLVRVRVCVKEKVSVEKGVIFDAYLLITSV